MADYADLELLQSQDRLWEMGTPGGAALGGKPKKRSDYGRRTPGLAEYNAAHGGSNAASGVGRRGRPALERGPMRDVINVPIFGPAEQYAMSQGMANQTMDAVQRENDSRVAQRREMRRMAHEQQLAAMRMQSENSRANADREAMLIRELLSGM
jgi:hypothetical protein